jgi:hypothetical protein
MTNLKSIPRTWTSILIVAFFASPVYANGFQQVDAKAQSADEAHRAIVADIQESRLAHDKKQTRFIESFAPPGAPFHLFSGLVVNEIPLALVNTVLLNSSAQAIYENASPSLSGAGNVPSAEPLLSDIAVTTFFARLVEFSANRKLPLGQLQGTLRFWLEHLQSPGRWTNPQLLHSIEELLVQIARNTEQFSIDGLLDFVLVSYRANAFIQPNSIETAVIEGRRNSKMSTPEASELQATAIRRLRANSYSDFATPYANPLVGLLEKGYREVPFELLNTILQHKTLPKTYKLASIEKATLFPDFSKYDSYVMLWLFQNAQLPDLSSGERQFMADVLIALAKRSTELSTTFLRYLDHLNKDFPMLNGNRPFYLELSRRKVYITTSTLSQWACSSALDPQTKQTRRVQSLFDL